MSVEKWRRRGVFGKSISVRDTASTLNPTVLGLLNNAGTLVPTSDGTSPAGTSFILDLTRTRTALGTYGTAIGTASGAFGTANGGTNGMVLLGFTAASATLGLVIGGTVYAMNWATAGGAPNVVVNPAGA